MAGKIERDEADALLLEMLAESQRVVRRARRPVESEYGSARTALWQRVLKWIP